MEVIVKSIHLPQQEGCQHIHVDIEYPDKTTDTVVYHLTDFTDEAKHDPSDELHVAIKESLELKEIDISKITRDDFKTEVLDTTLVITDDPVKLEIGEIGIEPVVEDKEVGLGK